MSQSASNQTVKVTQPSVTTRPAEMSMVVQTGMIRTLGMNLYTSLGKVLVEFVANAYDGDARKVEITIPEARIRAERARLREEARAVAAQSRVYAAQALVTTGSTQSAQEAAPREVGSSADESGTASGVVEARVGFDILAQLLPDDVEVVVKDDGHGMSWEEVESKFLPLNRQRRKDDAGRETLLRTQGGRYVMGRKGVGKLAGFGAAMSVTVWTTREGDDYATELSLTDVVLNEAQNISDIKIPVTYPPAPRATKGTRITLGRLRSDALRETLATVQGTLSRSFHAIRPSDFAIEVNGAVLETPVPNYEFIFPTELTNEMVAASQLASDTIVVPDVGPVPIRYYVGFLPRSQHLKSAERGARVYCNNRLAAGPSLFDLGTGMHSFHSTDYLECVVEADELDRESMDLINTARTQFKEGNEVVEALRAKITQMMTMGVTAHGRFRDQKAKEDLDSDPTARVIMRTVSTLPSKSRNAATRLLTTMAAQWGVGSDLFEELAPTIVHSINATDVLVRLVSNSVHPETIATILSQLRELSDIEKRDTLKLYRGRRGAIEKLEKLQEKGREDWHKRASEKALHSLFKECPWLIRTEFSNYIASDVKLTTTVSLISRELLVDEFAEPRTGVESDGREDTRRPDLVFVMSDPMMDGPHTLKIVELKSPSLPLRIEHFRQLEDYLSVVKRWCKANLPHPVRFHGYLIGAMPKHDSGNTQEYQLVEKYNAIGPRDEIQILGLSELIRDARTVHVEAIKAIEEDLMDEEITPTRAGQSATEQDR